MKYLLGTCRDVAGLDGLPQSQGLPAPVAVVAACHCWQPYLVAVVVVVVVVVEEKCFRWWRC